MPAKVACLGNVLEISNFNPPKYFPSLPASNPFLQSMSNINPQSHQTFLTKLGHITTCSTQSEQTRLMGDPVTSSILIPHTYPQLTTLPLPNIATLNWWMNERNHCVRTYMYVGCVCLWYLKFRPCACCFAWSNSMTLKRIRWVPL